MQSICTAKYMLWPTVRHTLILYQKDQMDLAGFWHRGYTRRTTTVIWRFSHLHLQSTSTISATLSQTLKCADFWLSDHSMYCTVLSTESDYCKFMTMSDHFRLQHFNHDMMHHKVYLRQLSLVLYNSRKTN